MPPPPLASWRGRYDSRGAPQAAAIAPIAMAHMSPLKVALLGAGGFVRDAYLDPLRANSGLLLLTAAWSRSEQSVEELVQAVQRWVTRRGSRQRWPPGGAATPARRCQLPPLRAPSVERLPPSPLALNIFLLHATPGFPPPARPTTGMRGCRSCCSRAAWMPAWWCCRPRFKGQWCRRRCAPVSGLLFHQAGATGNPQRLEGVPGKLLCSLPAARANNWLRPMWQASTCAEGHASAPHTHTLCSTDRSTGPLPPLAGKHVMSEKPVAPTLAQAEQLLAFHRSLPQVRQVAQCGTRRSMKAAGGSSSSGYTAWQLGSGHALLAPLTGDPPKP